MSQITTNVTSTPSVATSYVTDSGTAVPIANVLNIATTASGVNAANGITSSGATNNVTITLTNRISGTVTTAGAVTSNCLTFGLGAVPGVYAFQIFLSAFDLTTPSGAVYRINASIRTTGAAGVVINSVDFTDEDEEAAMIPADWALGVVGNAINLTVDGVAGLTIRWSAQGIYTFVS
jgi:hypothetical protein